MQTQLLDRATGNSVPVTIQNLDLYRFFLRVKIEELKPHYMDSNTLKNFPSNWQIQGIEPLNVIGSSTDGEFFIFYVETEAQTRARITHL